MIKISKLADYGVVILAELSKAPGVLLSAAELSGRTALPEPTVSKVLKTMVKGALVESVRGVKGGYRIQNPAQEITLARVITVVDGPIALTGCSEEGQNGLCCNREGSCSMKGRWQGVNMVMKQALEKVTLADLMEKKA